MNGVAGPPLLGPPQVPTTLRVWDVRGIREQTCLEDAQAGDGAMTPAQHVAGAGTRQRAVAGLLTSCSCMQTLLKALSQLALARDLGSCTSTSACSLQAHTPCSPPSTALGRGELAPTPRAGLRLQFKDPDGP